MSATVLSSGLAPIISAYGVQANIVNTTGSSSVTSAYGGYFGITRTLGTISNGYGIYTGAIQATNKWSIYASDATAPNYFAGLVGIGTTTPRRSRRECDRHGHRALFSCRAIAQPIARSPLRA